MAHDYDLFVIGAGSGGVRAARMSAGFGARVAIAEERYLGGTCVNVGCIPKKLFVYASHFAEELADSREYGWNTTVPAFDWPSLVKNKNREIGRLNGIYERLLEQAGVEILRGRAVLRDPHTVEMDGKPYTSERILVATGSRPEVPDVPGREHVVTTNDVFFLEKLPRTILIVGGGYIAVEFAGIFHGLGVETTLMYRGPLFLRGFDEESRRFLAEEMRKKGVRLDFDTRIERIERHGDALTALLPGGETCHAELILYATGRRPNTASLGLERAGIVTDENGAIVVDASLQSSVPSVHALGDVINRANLTPVATAEGTALARSLYGGRPQQVDYNGIPTCIFSQPNYACVGLTEETARATYRNIHVYRSTFTPLKHTLTGSQERTLMKLVVNADDDRVLGAHMVGSDAGEIIQGIAVAIKAGATKTIFDTTIGIHPTAAEEFVTMREPV